VTGPKDCSRRRTAVDSASVTAGGETMTLAIDLLINACFRGILEIAAQITARNDDKNAESANGTLDSGEYQQRI